MGFLGKRPRPEGRGQPIMVPCRPCPAQSNCWRSSAFAAGAGRRDILSAPEHPCSVTFLDQSGTSATGISPFGLSVARWDYPITSAPDCSLVLRNEPVAGAMRLGQRPEQPLGMPLKNRGDIYRVSSVPITASAGRRRREAMPISVSILVGGAHVVTARCTVPLQQRLMDSRGTLAFRIGGVAGHHSFALDRRQRHRDCCHVRRNRQALCPATGEPMKKKAHS